MSFNSATPIIYGGISSVVSSIGGKYPEPGTRVVYDGNEYMYVKNEGTTQASPGMYLTAQAGSSNYSCTITGVASYETPVGVVRHATMTTGTYGWVLTKGYGVAYVSASVAAGINLETVVDTGLWTTAVTGTVWGKLLSAASTAGSNITTGAYFNF